ncbi:HAMP domain-containing protein [Dactylosporangium sp. CS-047395]|uniref:sensor histidine kinase n=1 Tax=Dactylosporangium sp. CS-047395 TaxID=3239936 RepID=UPI003D89E109
MARLVGGLLLYLLAMGGVATVVLAAVAEQRTADRYTARAEWLDEAAGGVEQMLLDLDRTERGYLVTHDERMLADWAQQRDRLTGGITVLHGHMRDPAQAEQIRTLTRDSDAYLRDHAAHRTDPAAVREGDRTVAHLRAELDGLANADKDRAAEHEHDARSLARVAAVAVVAGTVASVVVGAGLIAYLHRSVVRPVRRAAAMAGRLADGDLDASVPEDGAGEVGRLSRVFNTMSGSMRHSVAQLMRYGRMQASLRRIATGIAQGARPAETLNAVAAELGRLVGTDEVHIVRYDDGGTGRAAVRADRVPRGTVVAAWGTGHVGLPVGATIPLDGDSVTARVRRTGRAARMDDYAGVDGSLAHHLHAHHARAAVGAPVRVDGRLWGVVAATVTSDRPLPPDAEQRLADSTELIATTIATAQARADLSRSRARVVVAADQARRQIERNLHDGVQQHLVTIAMGLRATEEEVPAELPRVRRGLSTAIERLTAVLDDLREISRGIHPPILTDSGLGPALKALARRCHLPVELRIDLPGRLPEPVEVAAYYVAAESFANAAKHADAELVQAEARVEGDRLQLSVRDNGAGGADQARGSGLVGLTDRVQALGGAITITSPPGAGTKVAAELPLDLAAAPPTVV